MEIVGKGVTVPEFRQYLTTLPRGGWSPRFIVVHNTWAPDLNLYVNDWLRRKNWTGEQWMRNLKSYYEGKGWPGGPHLFVGPDKIWLFNPLWKTGTHSPSWNKISWGVETVGNFDKEPFSGTLRANLIGALAAMHEHADLDPADYKRGVRGLHFHKEDPLTGHHSCPGRNMVKSEVVAEVAAGMSGSELHEHAMPSPEAQAADTSALPAEASTIRWVQQRLNQRGYGPLVEDNVVGPATRAAVRRYQSDHPPLVVDGIAGPMTRLSLARS